jgi:hypothetical protein
MSAPSTEPKSMIKKLVKAGISLSNIPSTIQISNMKSNLQHDTSDESPHRLQTFPQLIEYFEKFLIQSQEDYDTRG